MTTTIDTAQRNFKFRTKFKKILKEESDESKVTIAFERFCKLYSDVALKLLWNMTYSSDKAWKEIYTLGLDNKLISSENVINLRNELRYQYEQHADFNLYERDTRSLDEIKDEEVKRAYSALEKSTDSIVANVVFDYCIKYCTAADTEIARTLFLLQNEKENIYFGGIRSLNFDELEADYLKPYHIEIHNMLNALNNYQNNFELPFYMDEEEEKAAAEKEAKEVKEKTTQVNSEFKKLTPETILEHIEIFKSFTQKEDLNLLIQIGQEGFDLNEIIAQKEKIYNFVKIVDAF